MTEAAVHVPVLLLEVIEQLHPSSGCIYVDGNLGLGGHSEAILKHSSPDGQVIGLDWDERALGMARERLKAYGDRISFVRSNFAEIDGVLADLGVTEVDGILLDLLKVT